MVSDAKAVALSCSLVEAGKVEEVVWPKGGYVLYTPETVTVHDPKTQPETVPNLLVPKPLDLPMSEPVNRCVLAIAAFTWVDQGELMSTINTSYTEKLVASGSILSTGSIGSWVDFVSRLTKGVLPKDTTLKGQSWVAWLWNYLSPKANQDILAIHTAMVKILFVWAEWSELKVGQHTGQYPIKVRTGLRGPVVQSDVFVQYTKKDGIPVLAKTGIFPHEWKKNFPAPIAWFNPVKEVDTATAQLAYQTSLNLRGGGSNGVSSMIECSGFSYGQSKTTQRLCLIVSIAYGLFQLGKHVQISTVRVGDIAVLFPILEAMCPKDLKFSFLTNQEVRSKIPLAVYRYLTYSVAQDFVQVIIGETPFPTSSSAWEQEYLFPTGQFVIFDNIWRKADFTHPNLSVFTLPHRFQTDFRCLMTNVTTFKRLWGFDATSAQYVPIDLYSKKKTRSGDQVSLYYMPDFLSLINRMITDSGRAIFWWMNSSPFYSPLSNMLRRDFTKSQMFVLSDEDGEAVWEFPEEKRVEPVFSTARPQGI